MGARILPPFSAFGIIGGEVEPLAAWPTLDAALAALGHFGEGGAVVVGLVAVRVHRDTDERGREALRAALAPHGIRGLELPASDRRPACRG